LKIFPIFAALATIYPLLISVVMTGGYNYAVNFNSSMSSVTEYFGGRSWPSAARASMHNDIHSCLIVFIAC